MASTVEDGGAGHGHGNQGHEQTGPYGRTDHKKTMWVSIGLLSEFVTVVALGLLVYLSLAHG